MKYEISDEVLIERLVGRVENGNTFILKEIGKTIGLIRNLTPTRAYQLQQMIKYGASYQTIIERLSKITNINLNEIDKIFENYAKKDYQFAKKFYDYKGIEYIPFENFTLLNQQVKALSRMTKIAYTNLSNTSAIGFTIKDAFGNVRFKNISDAYQYVVDQAILSISQGKDTFDHQMESILKDLGSGVKVLDYQSGRTRRLDSALRMNLRGGLRQLHNEVQSILGESFGADGIEITVHEHPAPDHEDAQGKQFTIDEFNKLQKIGVAMTYDRERINMHYEWKTKEAMTVSFRPISQYNCYHNVRYIVLRVNKPQYTDKELDEIKYRNQKGFDYEGKHYSLYEGTQLQRKIETEIRKQKDIQIIGKEANNNLVVLEAQDKITQLTDKYRELSKISGLPTKMQRTRVTGYHRKATGYRKVKTL